MPAFHLIVPHAGADAPAIRDAMRRLHLPALRRLLARMQPEPLDAGRATDLSPPHERVLAHATGLWRGDGRTPWAAAGLRHAGADDAGAAWAWFIPCRWQVGRDRILMEDPATLELDEPASRALLDAMQPYFSDDGLQVEWVGPLAWRARGEMLREQRCAAIERVVGRSVDDWLPRDPPARPLRRLQQEMQMLLYTHPVNAQREAAGLPPVNSFWVTGAGALEPHWQPTAPEPAIDDRLRGSALAGDAAAWARAWQALERERVPQLVTAMQRGQDVRLSLCGDNSARTWTTPAAGWKARIAAFVRRDPTMWQQLEPL